ncbi:MAG: hypothetical protein ORN98_08780, partial [Alphaproteobacteria bacterium]|nr:hypothetical protein [Alphaproteobacteria bacterium]
TMMESQITQGDAKIGAGNNLISYGLTSKGTLTENANTGNVTINGAQSSHGKMVIVANHDITISGAQTTTNQGDLVIIAGHDIDHTAGALNADKAVGELAGNNLFAGAISAKAGTSIIAINNLTLKEVNITGGGLEVTSGNGSITISGNQQAQGDIVYVAGKSVINNSNTTLIKAVNASVTPNTKYKLAVYARTGAVTINGIVTADTVIGYSLGGSLVMYNSGNAIDNFGDLVGIGVGVASSKDIQLSGTIYNDAGNTLINASGKKITLNASINIASGKMSLMAASYAANSYTVKGVRKDYNITYKDTVLNASDLNSFSTTPTAGLMKAKTDGLVIRSN